MNTRSMPMKELLIAGGAALIAGSGYAMLVGRRRPDWTGKVVLITGGSRGLGLALAREFAARGSHLVLCARNTEELDRAKRDLAGNTGRVLTVPCDVTKQEQVNNLINAAVAEFGQLDMVINNAGVIHVGPVDTMTIEDFQIAMDVMFWGMVYTTLAALPHLRNRGERHIVNITSVGGKVSVPHLLPYSCAKFAAVAFSEGMRAEMRGTGVQVVTIAPGLMRTGSYVNALFKGAEEGEAGWFSAGASIPGVSMSAKRAAHQIIRAVESGRAERILSTPANILSRLHGLFPELTVGIMGLVNRLLPHGSERQELGAESPLLERPWMRAVTTLGRWAAQEYLQPARRAS